MTNELGVPNKTELLAALRSSGQEVVGRVSALPPAEASAAPAQVRRTEPGETPGTPTRIAQGGILSYNDRQVDKRAAASVQELLEEFQTNRAATIAAAESADEALFSTPIRSAGGITGPLASVLTAIAVLHVAQHVNDIAAE